MHVLILDTSKDLSYFPIFPGHHGEFGRPKKFLNAEVQSWYLAALLDTRKERSSQQASAGSYLEAQA